MNSFLRHLLIFILSIWHKLVSPFFGQRCRFYPSCSEYAMEALKKHGLIKGFVLSTRRVFCCNPLHSGGFDPVPRLKDSAKK